MWKLFYYGDLLPNTYYAKSAGHSFYSQGWNYSKLFFSSYYVFLLIPPLFLLSFWRKVMQAKQEERYLVPFLFYLPVLLHIVYITRVGGDFMFARFFIPTLPFLYLYLDSQISVLTKWPKVLCLAFVVVATVAYYNPYHRSKVPIIDGISHEHEIYKLPLITRLSQKINSWRPVFEQAKIRFAFAGSQAFYAYCLPNNYALEAETGLTNKELARQDLQIRGRVGHEKHASLDFLQKYNIDLHFYGPLVPSNSSNLVRIQGLAGEARLVSFYTTKLALLQSLADFSLPAFTAEGKLKSEAKP
ncbi:MAG: hypothetical protein AAF518_05685 [Spirochaetota bacterium]